jgi:hypothetical protein
MANIYATHFWLEGDEKFLKSLAEHIGEEGKTVADLFEEMNIPIEVDSYAFWGNVKYENGVLSFWEDAKWEQSEYVDRLIDENMGATASYYFCCCIEDDYFATDDYEGKYFPYRIVTMVTVNEEEEEDDDDEPVFMAINPREDLFFFKDEAEFVERLNKNGIPATSYDDAPEAARKIGMTVQILARIEEI